MTRMNPFKFAMATMVFLIVSATIYSSHVSAGGVKKLLDQTGCSCFTCPSCKHTCKLDSELVDVEKTCFETEEKVICIPRVVFPWQKSRQSRCGCTEQPCSNCTHNGAKTRKICVLKTKKYECPECKYTWTPEEKECGSGCAAGCCDTTSSCDAVDWTSQPLATNDGLAADSQEYPWVTAEPVVSVLLQDSLIKHSLPSPVALQQ